jgi:hypothetical protein
MNSQEMSRHDEATTSKERVSVDAKIEKGSKVGFDMGEIQQRMARMQELESKILPEQSKRVAALKRELDAINKEYQSLQEDANLGMAKFSDLQRLESVGTMLQSKQMELGEVESVRAESRRELALLNPDEYGDLYQLEKAQAEASKSAIKRAISEVDEDMIAKLQGQIKKN